MVPLVHAMQGIRQRPPFLARSGLAILSCDWSLLFRQEAEKKRGSGWWWPLSAYGAELSGSGVIDRWWADKRGGNSPLPLCPYPE